MDDAARLVTSVDLHPDDGLPPYGDSRASVCALHELELADGRAVVLLDDRGWSAGGPPDVWAHATLEEVVETSRAVVGPDDPWPGQSDEEATAAHWAHLAAAAQEQGVHVDAAVLAALPHHVEISQNIRARLAH